jgi:hypothetical protein
VGVRRRTTGSFLFSFFFCIFLSYFILFFFYSYMHTMFGSFLPPSPTPSLTYTTSSLSRSASQWKKSWAMEHACHFSSSGKPRKKDLHPGQPGQKAMIPYLQNNQGKLEHWLKQQSTYLARVKP